jgi:hypothetical protein
VSRPFFGDLNAEALVTRTTIRSDGQILLEERYVVTSAGKKILVGRWRQTDYALIEAIPPEILALAP